jgi:hypothetical protein
MRTKESGPERLGSGARQTSDHKNADGLTNSAARPVRPVHRHAPAPDPEKSLRDWKTFFRSCPRRKR